VASASPPTGGLRDLRRLEQAGAGAVVLDIPVIASLDAVESGSWVTYATLVEDAGADAVELNIYFVATSSASRWRSS
jgi:dihydroorotate dehydrogenase